MTQHPEYKMLVNGQMVNTGRSVQVINPANGEVFATAARADEAWLNKAIAAATDAFPAWAARSLENRSTLLLAVADAVELRLQEFAELLTREQGKPLQEAMGEIYGGLHFIRGFAAMRVEPRVLKESGDKKVIEHRVPLGVIGTITPWNYPFVLLIMKLAPALLAGNTVVSKPSPTTPLTTCLLGEVCSTILPPGVFNVVCDENDLGGLISAHPGLAKVSFTGSTATGKKIIVSAAPSLKRLTLELGGNDAAIVLDDVDPEETAGQIYHGAMHNAGQVCLAIKRVYVPRAMYERFCNELARLARAAVVGDGMAAGTQIGPVQNQIHFEKLKKLLADTKERGTIIAGGATRSGPGYFVEPTIVRDIADDSQLVAEEQFGPILPVLAYDHIDEAVTRANATQYGLGATVWGKDLQRATEIGMRMEAGTVWVNQALAFDVEVPLRGNKHSGIGGGELGIEGVHEFTQARIVSRVALAAPGTGT